MVKSKNFTPASGLRPPHTTTIFEKITINKFGVRLPFPQITAFLKIFMGSACAHSWKTVPRDQTKIKPKTNNMNCAADLLKFSSSLISGISSEAAR